MNIEIFREYCLTFPQVIEEMPFKESVLAFKIGGKIFALLFLEKDGGIVNLKCNPECALELREQYEDISPGYHMNKKHWNTIRLEGKLSNSLIKKLSLHSYRLVRNKFSKINKKGNF